MPKKQIGKKIDEQGNLTDLGYTVTQEEINSWNDKVDKDVNNLTNYTLAVNTASSIEMSIDDSTYVVSLKLKNAEGTQLGETQTIDLPLESVVVNGSYDSTTKEVVLTLDNGNEIRFSVADLVSGLATTSDLNNYLPKTGGTLTAISGDTALSVQSKSTSSYIGFKDSNGSLLGYYGVNSLKKPVFYSGGDKVLAYASDIRTKTSELENDSGFSTFSGNYNDLTNKPNLATVATSGSYSDLINKPTFSEFLKIYGADYQIIRNGNIGFPPLYIQSLDTDSSKIGFKNKNGTVIGTIGVYNGKPYFTGNQLALFSDIPTNNNQLTNGAGYITSNDLLNKIYPVGSIFITTSTSPLGTSSPASWLGGTWTQLKDRFLLAAGDTYSAGSEGGSDTHYHDYKIRMGWFYGEAGGEGKGLAYDYINRNWSTMTKMGGEDWGVNSSTNTATKSVGEYNIEESNGKTTRVSNLPPYLSVYMWKRIA